jgi:hypothetical protein
MWFWKLGNNVFVLLQVFGITFCQGGVDYFSSLREEIFVSSLYLPEFVEKNTIFKNPRCVMDEKLLFGISIN